MAPFDKNVQTTAESQEKVDPVPENEVLNAEQQHQIEAAAERDRQFRAQQEEMIRRSGECYCGVGRASMLAPPPEIYRV